MKYSSINIDFEQYCLQWENQLNDMSHILNHLNTYPELLKSIGVKQLITSDRLIQNQLDWFQVTKKYYGMEKSFFKSHWVSLDLFNYEFFIDMSDPKYPVFNFTFIFSEPYEYVKLICFESINDLLLAVDNKTDTDSIGNQIRDTVMSIYNQRCEDSERPGF